jgi:hypothetical protein
VLTTAERDAFAAVLDCIAAPVRLALTLRYREGPVSIDHIRRDLHDLHGQVDRKRLGRDYHREPAQRRSRYWAVGETLDSNPHVHAAWYFPDLEHAFVLARLLNDGIWETRYARGGTHDHRPYNNAYAGGNGWAGYACKSLQMCDNVILSDHLNIADT